LTQEKKCRCNPLGNTRSEKNIGEGAIATNAAKPGARRDRFKAAPSTYPLSHETENSSVPAARNG
jgi:hypothetical protein